MPKKKIEFDGRQELAKALLAAREGGPEWAWLTKLIRSAGWVQFAARCDSDTLLVTSKQIERRFAISARTVRNYISEGLPVAVPSAGNQPAWYDAFEFFSWWLDRQEAKRDGGGDGESSELKLEIDREKARRAKRQNDQAEGKLIEVAEVESQLFTIGRILREGVKAIERTHGKQVAKEVRGLLNTAEKAWQRSISDNVTSN